MSTPVLTTQRFMLRKLQVEDVGEHYLAWLRDPSASHIEASRTTRAMAELAAYVADKLARSDVVFLGIFERVSLQHIGNIKFEPMNIEKGYAVLGILIGEARWRGKGVAGEVIQATAMWLKAQGLSKIVLGVNQSNVQAVRAYEKAGFCIGDTPHLPPAAGVHRMTLLL